MFTKHINIKVFMKIRWFGEELFYAERWADGETVRNEYSLFEILRTRPKAKMLNLGSIIKRLVMKYLKVCPNRKHFILTPYQLILNFVYLTFQVMVTTDIMEELFGDIIISKWSWPPRSPDQTWYFGEFLKNVYNKTIKAVHENCKWTLRILLVASLNIPLKMSNETCCRAMNAFVYVMVIHSRLTCNDISNAFCFYIFNWF